MIKIDKDFKGNVWIFSDPHYNPTAGSVDLASTTLNLVIARAVV